jgi:hypothetical protein
LKSLDIFVPGSVVVSYEILSNPQVMEQKIINYGRPLWNIYSTKVEKRFLLALAKLRRCQNDQMNADSLMAALIMRACLSVAPSSSFASLLVKSYMGTLLFV